MVPYRVMNGAGNRFVILDAREHPIALDEAAIRRLADAKSGVGCDQVIVLEPADRADVFMKIYNADGGEVGACGNATRCIGWLLMEESGERTATIRTHGGLLRAERGRGMQVKVDMGPPRLTPREIPLKGLLDPMNLPELDDALPQGVAVGMGNPHVVFFLKDLTSVPLDRLGPEIEMRTDIFPERVNVNFARITSPGSIELRVWERGAGWTEACGTGACATLVAAVKQGLIGRKAEISLPGGVLTIEWRDDNHVWMTGPVEDEGSGELEL